MIVVAQAWRLLDMRLWRPMKRRDVKWGVFRCARDLMENAIRDCADHEDREGGEQLGLLSVERTSDPS